MLQNGLKNAEKSILTYTSPSNIHIIFKKAYDRVWRDGLWKTLWDEGIRGKMWRVIRSLYRRTQSCILLGKEKTDKFNINVGVRQGCVLSPALFSIYINRLAKELIAKGIGVLIGHRKVGILLYAYDIVLITNNRRDMKKALEIVANFGKKWRCLYSPTKTQIVIYGRGKEKKDNWKIGDLEIKQKDVYKS